MRRLVRYYELFMGDTRGIICDSSDLYGFNHRRLYEGVRIDDWDERITLWYETGEVEDYLHSELYWPVVSSKMRAAMERAAPGQAQYLPVQVRRRSTGAALEGYYAVNLLHRVEAFDWERSKYDLDTIGDMKYLCVFRLALVREAVAPYDLLRLAEDHLTVIISERVRVALGAAKVTGCIYPKIPVA